MAAAAAAVAISHHAVINVFTGADAVRSSEVIIFEPKGSIKRSFFNSNVKVRIIKPEGARRFLDVPT